jgi:hypothetical protein
MRTLLIASIVAGMFTASPVLASPDEAPPHNQIHANLLGFAGFMRLNIGSFGVGYERKLTDHHAFRVVGDFIHVHQASTAVQSHQWTFGGGLGYRYHFGASGGPFVGIETGYRRGFGHFGERDTPEHVRLRNEQLRVLPELGFRHLHARLPLAVVTRIALGYGPYTVTSDRDDLMGVEAVRFSEDVLAPLPMVLELELSVAYAF